MEGLEFYNHGSRIKFWASFCNTLKCVSTNDGIFVITPGEIQFEVFDDSSTVKDFDVAPDKHVTEMEYLELEEVVFFASEDEVFIFNKDMEVIRHKWPSQVLCAKLGPGLLVAIYLADGKVSTGSLDTFTGQLTNIIVGYSDAIPECSPVVWGSRSKNYKRGIKERTSTYVQPGRPSIDWTADGEYFAVNYFSNGERFIKVYSKTCDLLYKSETNMLPGLELPIAFRPNGSLIACVLSETGNDQEIILIQKNCEILQALKLSEVKIRELQWSPCGEILAVWHQSDVESWLDLYMISNTKWYLKQRLPFHNDHDLIRFKFIQSLKNSYIVELLFPSCMFHYQFVKKVAKSTKYDQEFNITCEVNKNELQCFVYDRGILPPGTEADYMIISDECISTVSFHNFQYKLAIVDIKYNVSIYEYRESGYKLQCKFQLKAEDAILPLTFYRYYFDHEGNFCAIQMDCSGGDNKEDILHVYSVEDGPKLLREHVTQASALKGQCVIERREGGGAFSTSCSLIQCEISNISITDFIILKYGLDQYTIFKNCIGQLMINNKKVPGSFTSMEFTDCHMLLTAKKDDQAIADDYLLSLDLSEATMISLLTVSDIFDLAYVRPIEKGAIILNTIPKSSAVILLLPRGNLECIQLRNKSLIILDKLLKTKSFNEAYDMIRFESMGLNLLVDLNAHLFKTNIKEIVLSLYSNGAINKFLLELNDGSCLDPQDLKIVTPKVLRNKRYDVCMLVVNTLLELENPFEYLTTLAIAAMCSQPSGYDSYKALEIIAIVVDDMFEKYQTNIAKAIENLSPYISYEQQYVAALKVFSPDLAELIAERSDMDPQQYRPFLNEIRTLDEISRRFKICTFLGENTSAALYYLEMWKQGTVTAENVLTYSLEHNCLKTYYEDLVGTDFVHKDISINYAAQLNKQGNYREAGAVLSNTNMHKEAIQMFMKKHLWRESVAVIYSIPDISNEDRQVELRNLAMKLETSNYFKEAADIYLLYCDDIRSAIDAFLQGNHFKEAYPLIKKHSAGDISKLLVPSIEQYLHEMIISMEEMHSKYEAKYNRLKLVRTIKSTEECQYEDRQDCFSEAGSVRTASTRSASSTTSSKRRAKQERKLTSTREGSKYEDIGLMQHLHKSIEETILLTDQIEHLCSLLDVITHREMLPFITTIMHKISDIKMYMTETSNEIWPECLKRFDAKAVEEASFINISELEFKYRGKPPMLNTKINDFISV